MARVDNRSCSLLLIDNSDFFEFYLGNPTYFAAFLRNLNMGLTECQADSSTATACTSSPSLPKADPADQCSLTRSSEQNSKRPLQTSSAPRKSRKLNPHVDNSAVDSEPTANALCELCKSDPALQLRWVGAKCPEDHPNPIYRSAKQIMTSAASGCRMCCMIRAECKDNWICWFGPENEAKDWFLDYYNACDHFVYVFHRKRQEVGASFVLNPIIDPREQPGSGVQQWMLKNIDTVDNRNEMALQLSPSDDPGHRKIAQIRDWLRTCEREHRRCTAANAPENKHGTKNIRLVHVGTMSDPKVHLSSTKNMGCWPRYTTLSHRWTSTTRLTQLQLDNLDRHFLEIDTDSWPTAYKHALGVTRELGIQYLWIDSICIVQDSQQDWTEQSDLMDQIYAYGTLNLATLSRYESDGLGVDMSSDPLEESPCVLAQPYKGETSETHYYLCSRLDYISTAIISAPLAKRGWVFQERILSTRTVHFGQQLHWHCASLHACTTFPLGYSFLQAGHSNCCNLVRDRFPMASIKTPLLDFVSEDILRSPESPQHLWFHIISVYTKTQFTNLRDRLIALKGIANAFARRYQLSMSTYAAGMWEVCLPQALLWERNDSHNQSHRDILKRHFPTWSWASSGGPIEVLGPNLGYGLAKIIRMQAPNDKEISLAPAYLILRGWIFIVQTPSPLLRERYPTREHIGYKTGSCTSEDEFIKKLLLPSGEILIDTDDANVEVGPELILLAIWHDDYTSLGGGVKGLLLKCIDDRSEIPSYTRLGFFECKTKGIDGSTLAEHYAEKLLTAPLIRLE